MRAVQHSGLPGVHDGADRDAGAAVRRRRGPGGAAAVRRGRVVSGGGVPSQPCPRYVAYHGQHPHRTHLPTHCTHSCHPVRTGRLSDRFGRQGLLQIVAAAGLVPRILVAVLRPSLPLLSLERIVGQLCYAAVQTTSAASLADAGTGQAFAQASTRLQVAPEPLETIATTPHPLPRYALTAPAARSPLAAHRHCRPTADCRAVLLRPGPDRRASGRRQTGLPSAQSARRLRLR